MRTGLNRECLDGMSLTKLAIGLSLSTVLVSTANAEFGIGADVEIDTDYLKNENLSSSDSDNDFDMGGRVKVSITGDHKVNDTVVLSGVGQLLIKEDGSTGVDDAYFRLGSDVWGIKFGRYEAIDLHSKGADTLLLTWEGIEYYQANAARGRIDDAGQIGLEISPSDRFTFNLDTVWGETDGDGGVTPNEDAIAGFRPAIQVNITDALQLTAGYDYLEDGDSETKGAGIALSYAADAFTLKLNVADGTKETAGAEDWDNTSININAVFGDFGIGYVNVDDDNSGFSSDTIYGHYQFSNLMGNENAAAKIGLSYTDPDAVFIDEDTGAASSSDSGYGIRLRFNYTF